MPVLEEHYTSCYGKVRARFGITLMLTLETAWILGWAIFALIHDTSDFLIMLPVFLLMLLARAPAFLGLLTYKPVFMQIYLISYVLELLIIVIIAILINAVSSWKEYFRKQHGRFDVLAMVAVFIAYFTLWGVAAKWQFYRYVRDLQLEKEQQENPAIIRHENPKRF
ncbi:unnamed protein product, partial [Mesorhabditis spiculigera]